MTGLLYIIVLHFPVPNLLVIFGSAQFRTPASWLIEASGLHGMECLLSMRKLLHHD